jgi:predicted transcriptional regulator
MPSLDRNSLRKLESVTLSSSGVEVVAAAVLVGIGEAIVRANLSGRRAKPAPKDSTVDRK